MNEARLPHDDGGAREAGEAAAVAEVTGDILSEGSSGQPRLLRSQGPSNESWPFGCRTGWHGIEDAVAASWALEHPPDTDGEDELSRNSIPSYISGCRVPDPDSDTDSDSDGSDIESMPNIPWPDDCGSSSDESSVGSESRPRFDFDDFFESYDTRVVLLADDDDAHPQGGVAESLPLAGDGGVAGVGGGEVQPGQTMTATSETTAGASGMPSDASANAESSAVSAEANAGGTGDGGERLSSRDKVSGGKEGSSGGKKQKAGAPPPEAPSPPKHPPTTSKRSSKKKKGRNIAAGLRVRITRDKLYHASKADEQHGALPREWPGDKPCYGTVISGSSKQGWNVDFDNFPVGHKRLNRMGRGLLHVLEKGEEESPISPSERARAEVEEELECESDEATTENLSFCKKTDEELCAATEYDMKIDPKRDISVKWDILSDGVHITKFSDLICGGLKERDRKHGPSAPARAATAANTKLPALERIPIKEDSSEVNYPLTQKDRLKGRNVGRAKHLGCWQCRRYCLKDKPTIFRCSVCGTALCNMPRNKDDSRREGTCQWEHFFCSDKSLRCEGEGKRKSTVFPVDHRHALFK